MSVYLTSRIWREAPYGGTELLVLLACADAASDDGNFWHSVPKLAAKARIGDRAARKHLAHFVERGVLARVERAGRSNIWHLRVPGEWAVRLEEYIALHAGPGEASDATPLSVETGVEEIDIPLSHGSGDPCPTVHTPLSGGSPLPCPTVQGTPVPPDSHNHLLTVSEPSDLTVSESGVLTLLASLSKETERADLWRQVKSILAADGTVSGAKAIWLDGSMLHEAEPRTFVLLTTTNIQRNQIRLRFAEILRLEFQRITKQPCTLAVETAAKQKQRSAAS